MSRNTANRHPNTMSNPSESANKSSMRSNVGANNLHPMSADPAGATGKRSIEDTPDHEKKQMKVDNSLNQRASPFVQSEPNNRPGFVRAATLVTQLEEVTDEELLQFTLEFERKHGL